MGKGDFCTRFQMFPKQLNSTRSGTELEEVSPVLPTLIIGPVMRRRVLSRYVPGRSPAYFMLRIILDGGDMVKW